MRARAPVAGVAVVAPVVSVPIAPVVSIPIALARWLAHDGVVGGLLPLFEVQADGAFVAALMRIVFVAVPMRPAFVAVPMRPAFVAAPVDVAFVAAPVDVAFVTAPADVAGGSVIPRVAAVAPSAGVCSPVRLRAVGGYRVRPGEIGGACGRARRVPGARGYPFRDLDMPPARAYRPARRAAHAGGAGVDVADGGCGRAPLRPLGPVARRVARDRADAAGAGRPAIEGLFVRVPWRVSVACGCGRRAREDENDCRPGRNESCAFHRSALLEKSLLSVRTNAGPRLFNRSETFFIEISFGGVHNGNSGGLRYPYSLSLLPLYVCVVVEVTVAFPSFGREGSMTLKMVLTVLEMLMPVASSISA